MKTIFRLAFATLAVVATADAVADTFGSGDNVFEIAFTTIDAPNNPPDTTGDPNPGGAVTYTYRIGTYEISEQMIDKANALGSLGITKDTRGPDKPATTVSWYNAARFVNWLNTSTGGLPAYKFDGAGNFQLWTTSDPGYDANNLYRNRLAMYFLPSANEWYKAAYYEPSLEVYYDYPTGSDGAPVSVSSGTTPNTAVFRGQSFPPPGPADVTQAGGLSPFGTMAQGGNVAEWEETDLDLVNDSALSDRAYRGGGWTDGSFSLLSTNRSTGTLPWGGYDAVGFRVASLLEVPQVLGDYNHNGIVDAADYTVWRDTLGSTTDLRANGDDSGASAGVIDAADYLVWTTNFGSSTPGGLSADSAIPEPATLFVLSLVVAAAGLRPHRLPCDRVSGGGLPLSAQCVPRRRNLS